MSTLAELQAILTALFERGTLAIAYSGGLDSRFLAHVALMMKPERVLLLHAVGPHTTAVETARAEDWAVGHGAVFVRVEVNPLQVREVRENSRERCYYCKRGLFQALLHQAGEAVLVDGSNASDTQGYRPGLKALAELGIRSPLMVAGLTKPQIHDLAAELELSEPWQRARPCLLTRVPYGMPLDESVLRELEAQEARVELVLGSGPNSPDFRLRVVPDEGFLLQIQSAEEALLRTMQAAFPSLCVTLVEQVSGYYDRECRPSVPLY